jgi:hypothetical protein
MLEAKKQLKQAKTEGDKNYLNPPEAGKPLMRKNR